MVNERFPQHSHEIKPELQPAVIFIWGSWLIKQRHSSQVTTSSCPQSEDPGWTALASTAAFPLQPSPPRHRDSRPPGPPRPSRGPRTSSLWGDFVYYKYPASITAAAFMNSAPLQGLTPIVHVVWPLITRSSMRKVKTRHQTPSSSQTVPTVDMEDINSPLNL